VENQDFVIVVVVRKILITDLNRRVDGNKIEIS
jgi:hypothetical protein